MEKNRDYIFMNKSAFFPKQGILAVGDLHLGYEEMLKQAGINMPTMQIKDIISDLKSIFSQIKDKGYSIKKIIFLGDIKHFFGYEFRERKSFDDILKFLKDYFDEKNIILIRGNHDTMGYSGKKMRNYYINDGTAFLHGHKQYPEIYTKKVKAIVIGHLHPSVIISDKANIKREKFKCFLVGKMKGRKLIALPSFFETVDGVSVNDYREEYHDYNSIVPRRNLLNSEIFAIGKKDIFDFGKVRDLD